jgi:hypothetical protein
MTGKSKNARTKARDVITFVESIYRLVEAMEEPLRDAQHTLNLLSLADPKDGRDLEAIAFVATKGSAQLESVRSKLRQIFELCSKPT